MCTFSLFEATLDLNRSEFSYLPIKFMVLLLWASKFAMAKIECSKETPLGVPFILLVMVQESFIELLCLARK